MADEEWEEPEYPIEEWEEPEYPYDAFDKYEYQSVFRPANPKNLLRGYTDSYFQSSKVLIDGIANGELSDSTHGIAATFLFRHYLELTLKELVFAGLYLKDMTTNADPEALKQVRKKHFLKDLWDHVREDGRTKVEEKFWNSLDIAYVEELILEFDAVDRKSVGFRYEDEATHIADFKTLHENLNHVHEVLRKLSAYLTHKYFKNAGSELAFPYSWLEVPDFD